MNYAKGTKERVNMRHTYAFILSIVVLRSHCPFLRLFHGIDYDNELICKHFIDDL